MNGSPTPAHTVAQGYGNIYTPHAGSMVIQVQRELGLANRTIVLSPRKVRLLRFFTSRVGVTLAVMLAASWLVLAVQAVRVPLLTSRLRTLEHTAQRLDTLETELSQLQARYNQVHRLLGTSATQASQQQITQATPSPTAATAAPATGAPTTGAAVPAATAPSRTPAPATPKRATPAPSTASSAPPAEVAPPPPQAPPSEQQKQ